MIGVQSATAVLGLSAALGGLLWAASSDIRTYQIPNRASALVVLAYAAAIAWMPWGVWLAGWAVGFAIFGLTTFLFARGLLGGGDVKLAAAAALWAGATHLSDFAFVTATTGALLAAVMLSPARRLLPQGPQGAAASGASQPMPFGAPLAAGGAWVLALHAAVQF